MTQSQLGGVTIVRPTGALTLESIELIRPHFERLTGSPSRIVVDMADVTLMTTPGLSMLLAGAKRLAECHGKMALTGAKGVVADLLHVCKLDDVFPVIADFDAAVKHVQD